MRKNIEEIEIKEPPIQEINKKRSCIKRTCFTGCGCIIFFIIVSLVILKYVSVPRPKELKKIPDYFPAQIPIYDQENIEKISFISGKERGRTIEIIAFVPKIILSPVILALEKNLSDDNGKTGGQNKIIKWSDFINLIKKPVADHRDQIQIEWKNANANPSFIVDYYQLKLKEGGFDITVTTEKENLKQFKFNKEKSDGAIYLEDDPEKTGTDYLSLTVFLYQN